jgi:hypothetical protein
VIRAAVTLAAVLAGTSIADMSVRELARTLAIDACVPAMSPTGFDLRELPASTWSPTAAEVSEYSIDLEVDELAAYRARDGRSLVYFGEDECFLLAFGAGNDALADELERSLSAQYRLLAPAQDELSTAGNRQRSLLFEFDAERFGGLVMTYPPAAHPGNAFQLTVTAFRKAKVRN